MPPRVAPGRGRGRGRSQGPARPQVEPHYQANPRVHGVQGQFVAQQQNAAPQIPNIKFDQFIKQKPPEFDVSFEVSVVNNFRFKLEKIFARIGCTDEEMKYFPDSLRDKNEQEFLTLTQGDMSVLDYETKFDELSQFASAIVDDNAKKAKRFLKGLRGEIRIPIASERVTTYADIVDRALNVENEVEAEKPKAPEKKRSADLQPLQYVGKQVKRENFESNSFRRQNEWCDLCKRPHSRENCPRKNATKYGMRGHLAISCQSGSRGRVLKCARCGKSHDQNKCPWVTGSCFECGQQGHRAAVCKRKETHGMSRVTNAPTKGPFSISQGKQDHQKPKTQGMFYATNRRDVQASNDVVTGILPVSLGLACVLFDPGATHSFMLLHS
ncbi:hypothetical protein LIER_40508 [Lithospermum erythrorhizon]|uniref:CCHC-type domain-containing protein n=1 Tax=Lithospermum erythrorhizon TaxID=34254 RepID=A0AAV3QYN8_LITER